MSRLFLALVAVCAAGLASAAPGGARAPTRSSGRAARAPQVHRVEIGGSRRARPITPRMMRLPYLRSLRGERSTLRAGLATYRSVRQRGRELRARLGDTMRVRTLVKSDSFIVDRYDFRSRSPGRRPKILVVGGVHSGSEPVGVETAMQLIEGLAGDPSVLEHFDLTVVPLANPKGLLRTPETVSKNGTPGRYTTENVDLNRSFFEGKWTAESRALARMMKSEKFDAVLDLHGAGSARNGFFAIRGGPDGGVAARFMAKLGGHPILDRKGAGKTYRLDAPGVVTSSNRGTLKQFAFESGTKHSYTFEAPGRLAPGDQVKGQLAMVRAAFSALRGAGERRARRE